MCFVNLLYVTLAFGFVDPPVSIGQDLGLHMKKEDFVAYDAYNDKTPFLHDGEKLIFYCECQACYRSAYNVRLYHENSPFLWSAVGEQTLVVTTLLNKTFFGNYFCKAEDSKTDSFDLSYLICDENSDVCSRMNCIKPSRFTMCVLTKNNTSPTTCEKLPSTTGCIGSNKMELRSACLKNSQPTTLCDAYSNAKDIGFIGKDRTDCSKTLIVKSDEKKIEVPFGDIGQFGSKFIIESSESQFVCNEKGFSTKWQKSLDEIARNTFVSNVINETILLKIECKTKNQEIRHYFYNLRFYAYLTVERKDGKLICKLNGVQSKGTPNYKYKFEIEQDGFTIFNETTTATDTSILAKTCANYTCKATIFFQHCSPHHKAKYDVQLVAFPVKENCTKSVTSKTPKSYHYESANKMDSGSGATDDNKGKEKKLSDWLWYAIGGGSGVLLLIIVMGVVILKVKSNRRKKEKAEREKSLLELKKAGTDAKELALKKAQEEQNRLARKAHVNQQILDRVKHNNVVRTAIDADLDPKLNTIQRKEKVEAAWKEEYKPTDPLSLPPLERSQSVAPVSRTPSSPTTSNVGRSQYQLPTSVQSRSPYKGQNASRQSHGQSRNPMQSSQHKQKDSGDKSKK